MKISIQKKELLFLALAVVVLILLFFSLQWFWKKPVVADLERMKQEKTTIQKLIDEKQSDASNSQGLTDENSYFLQKKVPVKPNIPELIIDIEKAELSSLVSVQSMSITESSTGVQIPVLSEEIAALLSPNLQKVSMSLQVEANKYSDLESFFEELEANERITRIENVSFAGPNEIIREEEIEETNLSVSLTVSSYFLTNITSLENQVPSLEVSPGDGKKNPLHSLTDDE